MILYDADFRKIFHFWAHFCQAVIQRHLICRSFEGIPWMVFSILQLNFDGEDACSCLSQL